MKYYKLIKNFNNYTHYKKGVKYPENYVPPHFCELSEILADRILSEDWAEVKPFKYGK